MNISIEGHNIEVTQGLHDHVTQKLTKVTKHFDNITSIHTILKVEKMIHGAEATIHLPGTNIFANSEHDDLYVAIDHLMDKLIRQIEKYKNKMRNH